MNTKINVKELAKLIKICKTEGVSHLKFDGIEISMVEPEKPTMTPVLAKGSAKKAKAIEKQGILQQQYDAAQLEMETLQLENPAAYEELLLRGQLEEKDH